MIRSLRSTLLISLLLPLLILLSVGTLVVYRLALNYSENAYDRALLDSTNDIGLITRASLDSSGRIELPPMMRDLILADKYDKVFFSVLDDQGTLIAGDGKLVLPPPDANVEDEVTFYDTTINGEGVRGILTKLHVEFAGKSHTWRILAGETRNRRRILANDILTGFVVPQALVILLAVGLVMFGIKQGLSPLESLRSAVARRKPSDTEPLNVDEVPDEVRPLLHEINRSLERLQTIFDAQIRFIADAAHQLRTPLAGLSAQTDLARSQKNSTQTERALDQIKAVSIRLNHVVSQLLSLARNEPGAGKMFCKEILDLNATSREIVMNWVDPSVKCGIDLGFEGSERPVMIAGDVRRITELLDNLLDNAVRYCPRGSQITVRVGPDRTLCVEDNGPGIPPGERELVFDRFHRLADSEREGSGLGLAIVKEIAAIHGGTVQVIEGENGRGALFCVRFPEAHLIE